MNRMVSSLDALVTSPTTTRGMPNWTIAPVHMKHGCSVVYMVVRWRLVMRPACRNAAISPWMIGLPSCTSALWPSPSTRPVSLSTSTPPIGQPPSS